MNRTTILVGILVVLLGVAGFVWWNQSGTEVDPAFANAKTSFSCPHCNSTFELTGEQVTQMTRDEGGITCPLCGQKINDFVSAQVPKHQLGGDDTSGSQHASDEGEVEVPPRVVGGRQKIGG